MNQNLNIQSVAQSNTHDVSTMARRDRIKLYFSLGGWSWSLVLIGFLTLLLGIGFILIGIGIWRILRNRKHRPTDAQVDAWLKEDMLVLSNRALQKFGIEPTTVVKGPLFVLGYPSPDDVHLAGLKLKVGKDKRLRLSSMSANILFINGSQLFSYKSGFDFMSGNPVNEGTHELFLQDIVSVSTQTDSALVYVPGRGAVQANRSQIFAVVTTGGTAIRSILSAPEMITRLGAGALEFPLSNADLAVSEIRNQVRLKKSS